MEMQKSKNKQDSLKEEQSWRTWNTSTLYQDYYRSAVIKTVKDRQLTNTTERIYTGTV